MEVKEWPHFWPGGQHMKPHYYLMKNKKILRLEFEMSFKKLPHHIQENALEIDEAQSLDQEQANWRVVIFRDEIMELDEYQEWLSSPEALMCSDEYELDLTAN